MKFNEAMKLLEQGKKITRYQWTKDIYFLMNNGNVNSYQPKLCPYTYNEDIMVSYGWKILDVDGEFKFYDIIDYLLTGSKAKLKEWKESFIYLDVSTKSIILHSMDIFPFCPDFSSFLAEDWVEIK